MNTDVSMPDENARPLPITTSARRSGSSRSSLPSARSSCHIWIVKRVELVGAVEPQPADVTVARELEGFVVGHARARYRRPADAAETDDLDRVVEPGDA